MNYKIWAMVKSILLFIYCCAIQSAFGQYSAYNFINPTGTYILKGEKQKNEILGNFAEIRIKLLTDTLLAFTMYCNKGYPDYTAGSLTDTVSYFDNRAVHLSEIDASCQIQFDFDNHRLHIKTVYTDPFSTCGFEKGVLPLGYIDKYSSVIPIIQSLSRAK
jgi:hypothetical protein